MLVSASQLAQRLGISRRAVYKAIETRRYEAVRIFGDSGPLRIFADDQGRPLSPPRPSWQAWWKVSNLARALGVTPRIVVKACSAGRVEARALPGGHWRVLVDQGTGLPVLVHK